ncbi:MAG: hypothetical protein M0R51_18245 [Clostridia bacterium]|jgi:hypothetical protein|nr:hypothetical protein [Clostridia bacterium]
MNKDIKKGVKSPDNSKTLKIRPTTNVAAIFKALGYAKRTSFDTISWHNLEQDITIVFWLEKKFYSTYKGLVDSPKVDLRLHQAITQQIKELGWK